MKKQMRSMGCVGAGLVLMASALAQGPVVKSGAKIAFLGDSITAQGASGPGGYVRLVISGLEANGIKAEAIPAGISGHKSNQMLERLERDVLNKKPTWMTLSCGVNDVWHGEKGVPLDQYKQNITKIVDRCQAVGIKVMILTSTMITEDQKAENNQKLIPYNDFLRALAAEKHCLLADLNAEMQAALAQAKKNQPRPQSGNYLTADGVHMNPAGNQMMALGVLQGFGLGEPQLAKARAYWLDIPGTCELAAKAKLSLRQYQQLSALAAQKKCSVDSLVGDAKTQSVEALLKK
jgi:lysophospholipase L1-like esterase